MMAENRDGMRVLIPSLEENWLTNGETYSEIVYLGSEASANDWWEITNEEYEQSQAEEGQ